MRAPRSRSPRARRRREEDAELALVLEAEADHQLVALLEDVQRDDLAREQDEAEREQREALDRFAHRRQGSRAVWLKLDPDRPIPVSVPRFAREATQGRREIKLSLTSLRGAGAALAMFILAAAPASRRARPLRRHAGLGEEHVGARSSV